MESLSYNLSLLLDRVRSTPLLSSDRTWGQYTHAPAEDSDFDVTSSDGGEDAPSSYSLSDFPKKTRKRTRPPLKLPHYISDEMPTSRSFTRYILPIGLVIIGGLAIVGTALPATSYWKGSRLHDVKYLDARIKEGAPILGYYSETDGDLANWMKAVPDSTPLAKMNLPGTHDAATWNYTQETQDRFINITGPEYPPKVFRCQERSLFAMLGDGIRVFDMRIGFLPNGKDIGFYHGPALLSDTATIEDVFYGFYKFLDNHPSETLLMSIKVDNTTFQPSDYALQERVYDLLTQGVGKRFWIQDNATLRTLGETRGKLTFLRRLDWASLTPSSYPPIGVALPPPVWLNNAADFSILYNSETNMSAYIEDYYEIGGEPGAETKVTWKYNATVAHLEKAAEAQGVMSEELFISFASGEKNNDEPPAFPITVALGNGTTTGVNQRLLEFLKDKKQQRYGILFLDWYSSVPGLVQSFIDSSL